ncbi:MAG: SMI1/KNR4 family protein [Gemmataceae bacterium]|nr:SMI1/KNR4 family protein [Gemmataceae bacterium]
MQKFTRPITREIELAGERLALALSADGISVRPVGSRAAPRQISWAAVLCHLSGQAKEPDPEQLAAAVAGLRKGGGAKPASKAEAAEPDSASLARLERWLAKHRPRFLANLRPGATPIELDALRAQLGMELPEGLRTLLAWHNGQGEDHAGQFEQDWRLMSADQIVAAKRELDLQAPGNGARTGWEPSWIPCLDDDAGDYLCLDTSLPGEPVRAFWLGNAEHPIVAPSLADWVKDFVEAVEAGAYHVEPERGTFLRRHSGER